MTQVTLAVYLHTVHLPPPLMPLPTPRAPAKAARQLSALLSVPVAYSPSSFCQYQHTVHGEIDDKSSAVQIVFFPFRIESNSYHPSQKSPIFVLSKPICVKWLHIRLTFRVFRRHWRCRCLLILLVAAWLLRWKIGVILLSKKLVTVSIWQFRIIVLVSNRIEYWSNCSIRFEISNICTALDKGSGSEVQQYLKTSCPTVYAFVWVKSQAHGPVNSVLIICHYDVPVHRHVLLLGTVKMFEYFLL